MTNETVIGATKTDEWRRREKKKGLIIAGVLVAVMYLLGTFDVFLVKLGLGFNFYECVQVPAGVMCEGPWSPAKPPSGMSVHDFADF